MLVAQPQLDPQLTRDAVVAVAERGDLFTAEVVAEVVEAAEEVVEQPHQLRRRLVRAHLGEAHDVGEQDAHVLHRVHVERPEDVADVTLQQVWQGVCCEITMSEHFLVVFTDPFLIFAEIKIVPDDKDHRCLEVWLIIL